MRALVTRPKNTGKKLCEALNALGIVTELFPTIEIIPTPYQKAFEEAIQQLNNIDIAIFTSQPAAEYTMKALRLKIKDSNLPFNTNLSTHFPQLHWVAIGKSTAKILQDNEVQSVLFPLSALYESESLLTLPLLQKENVKNKRIFIFRGNEGRALLSKTLIERGALVAMIETYQRSLPLHPMPMMIEKLSHWQKTPFDRIVTTSKEGLLNLLTLIGNTQLLANTHVENFIDEFKQIPIVVVGSRMLELAYTLGFKKPILSQGADNPSIINAILGKD